MAYKDKICRIGFLLFALCAGPVILIGYPQSRYVYLSAAFVYWIPARFFTKTIYYQCLAILYLIAATVWTVERRDLWIEADLQARFYKKSVESAQQLYEKLALVDVPDQIRGVDRVWLPVVWRNGTDMFGVNAIVMTPFNEKEIAENELPEGYQLLKIGDRRKSIPRSK